MIQISDSTDRGIVPLIFCDHCGKRIVDAQMAAAVTLEKERFPNGNAKVAHVHKGTCHDAVEKSTATTGWVEMTQHLRLLLGNVKVELADLEKEGKLDKAFGLTTE